MISSSAWACSCVAPTMIEGAKSFNTTDIIVKGIVTEDSMGWEGRRPIITFEIEDVMKGQNIPDNITIDYNPSTAACGHNFTVGEDYILALYDTRTINLTDENKRGYGFRIMTSCHQTQVRNYIQNKESEKE